MQNDIEESQKKYMKANKASIYNIIYEKLTMKERKHRKLYSGSAEIQPTDIYSWAKKAGRSVINRNLI